MMSVISRGVRCYLEFYTKNAHQLQIGLSVHKSTPEIASRHLVAVMDIAKVLEQGCTTHGPDPAPEHARDEQQIKEHKKLLVNDGNFMNEFKLHGTISNFATYYNSKQL